jgi:hypothetical protein
MNTMLLQRVDLCHWLVTDRVSGRRYVTRYAMCEASAKDLDPQAKRVDATHVGPTVLSRAPKPVGRELRPSRL